MDHVLRREPFAALVPDDRIAAKRGERRPADRRLAGQELAVERLALAVVVRRGRRPRGRVDQPALLVEGAAMAGNRLERHQVGMQPVGLGLGTVRPEIRIDDHQLHGRLQLAGRTQRRS
ncbi:hypothetical protein [uncultured Bradyrhizobium sp.]|uniref:hypothetical protein n=1 Tax=uncultured Bradyrhizobium sp. TaxID=199684 RepID=UPI00261D8A28|nr:hypothetical protein [uncultured Bradyrhizobium sp.]